MSEFSDRNALVDLLEVNKDDPRCLVELLKAGLHLERPIMDYFAAEEPLELTEEEFSMIDNARSLVQYILLNCEKSASFIGLWLEAPKHKLEGLTPMEELFINPSRSPESLANADFKILAAAPFLEFDQLEI